MPLKAVKKQLSKAIFILSKNYFSKNAHPSLILKELDHSVFPSPFFCNKEAMD